MTGGQAIDKHCVRQLRFIYTAAMPSLESMALNSSTWLWDELHDALALRTVLHEVACTDFFLKRIQKEAGAKIIVETITKEVEIGADWEWWFMTKSGAALPVRVQAKVMYMEPLVRKSRADDPWFKQLHYTPNGAIHTQTETLINRAIKDGMFPLYCLYTAFNDSFIARNPGPRQVCVFYKRHRRQYPAFGVSLLGAEAVHVNPGKYLEDFMGEFHAFPCLFTRARRLADLEWYLRGHWIETSRMLEQGVDRNGNPALPGSGTFAGSLIRSLDDAPDYVQRLFQLAQERLVASDHLLEEEIAVETGEQRGIPEEEEIVLPEGTGRVTLFLLADFED